MSKFTWIHLSDLHFQYFEDKRLDVQTIRSALNNFIKNNSFTYIFITGDVANKGDYSSVDNSLKSIFGNINQATASESIFWAAGNHDIVRDINNRSDIIKKIRNTSEKCEAFHKVMLSEEKNDLINNTNLKYKTSYKKFYPKIDDDAFEKLFRIVPLDELNLVVLNTSLFCLDENDYGNLFVVDPEFPHHWHEFFTDERKQEDKNNYKPTFVIAHHGKNFFHPKHAHEIEGLFKDSVDLFLCGHWHELGYDHFYIPRDQFYKKSDSKNYPIYQIICGSVNSGPTEPCFYKGEYDNGYITTTPIKYNKGTFEWTLSKDDKIEKRLLPRFKSTIKMKSNAFILFIVGAQAVGKTTIARELVKEDIGGNVFQICEVDFLVATFRKELLILYDKFRNLSSEKEIDSLLNSAEIRKISYQLDLVGNNDQLESQNDFLHPRLWAICQQQIEKGIPLIVEGLNIDAKKMIEEIKNYENATGLKCSYLFVNLYIENEDVHYEHLRKRQKLRKSSETKIHDEREGFNVMRIINKFYRDKFESLYRDYPDRVLFLENLDQDRIEDNVNTIIKRINEIQFKVANEGRCVATANYN